MDLAIENPQPALQQLLDTELRHIEASKLTKLSTILDNVRDYKKLIEELTKPVTIKPNQPPKPTLDLSINAINIIDRQLLCGKSPSLALLNHWAITGRRRPTVRSLLNYLQVCNLERAKDCVLSAILGLKLVSYNPPVEQPVKQTNKTIDDDYRFDNLQQLVDSLTTTYNQYSFESIYETTNRFCHRPYDLTTKTGTKLGEGRFSSVFLAQAQLSEDYPNGSRQVVAAKLLKSECNEKYLANELNLMSLIEHENVLKILGVSLGSTTDDDHKIECICLIYPFMENGSLLDCLSIGLVTRNNDKLTCRERLEIAVKVARGLVYLHTFKDGPIVHRDVKTANIFIDRHLEPKVGDFTLVRQLDSSRAMSTQFSQNVIGTSVYMPPEAFRGDISIKFDTFSYGIVLLELLTGMKSFDKDLDEDLFTHISERLAEIDEDDEHRSEELRKDFIKNLLDGPWDEKVAMELFRVAMQATADRKSNRPKMSDILPGLESLLTL